MFVYRPQDLPLDPVFPADLEKLGYFINEKDQIRKISNPEQEFQFKINRNDRWNDLQRGAMNECIRTIVSSRLRSLGLTTFRLPLSSGPKDPHVPIWVSANLARASRVIAVFGEPIQDLGIWAYRTVGTEGVNAGSAVAFARAILGKESAASFKDADTALVLANTGQLIWHCDSSRAVTHQTWLALPRSSAVDAPLTMTRRNKIPSNQDWQEHVACIFEDILSARGRLVREDVKIDIIGLSEGGLGAIRYLEAEWGSWRPYISAIALSNPLHHTHIDLVEESPALPSSFISFIFSRCRAYVLSDKPVGFPVPGFQEHGCNCYSSGEALHTECIMPNAWEDMLEWLAKIYANPSDGEAHLEFKELDGATSETVAGDGD
ncbi:isoform 3 of protein FAM172A [Aspergillus udagawae]|uniref:Isoform 3 of protein FAM172A n=1 Tax=Aspergillus udagawae TaxID=91492 RepID=A0ABQ1AV93_9EURO|nr:isoform 3 of protein FAM172A [Aspergillus udagawae]GFF88687.1 isoform 3 of protein FAM172A [Aspergillus udagawae]GFG15150.1 isoform 3 of protein FAM172A [Aspergillus udagawae]GFG23677.1 isoform 3 of protein FAM172A [Aspergillus udagawae]